MTIPDFAKKVTWHDTGGQQASIANVMQILKVINKATHGILYAVIKALPK